MVLHKNMKTGQDEWVVVEGEEEDDSRGLIAASSYLDMLTDKKRNRAYRVALENVLASPKYQHQPRILDIGTGTGLLALMAAQVLRKQRSSLQQQAQQHGETSPPVVACELFPTMARVARRVVAKNGFQSEVSVIDKRSDELVVCSAEEQRASTSNQREAKRRDKMGCSVLPDMAGKADVIVTEIFDSALLGEGLLPSMRHAAQHLMREGGCVIPARATVWVQLVHCPAILEWTSPVCPNKAPRPTTGPSDGSTAKRSRQDAPHGWGGGSMSADLPRAQLVLRVLEDLNAAAVAAELQRGAPAEIGGDDVGLGCDDGEGDEGEGCCDEDLYSEGSEGREDGGGPACRWQELHELHVDVVQAQSQLHPLSSPKPVMEFDLAKPPPGDQVFHDIKLPVTQTGSAHGFVLWWQLDMLPQQHLVHHSEVLPKASEGPNPSAYPAAPRSLMLSTAPAWIGPDPGLGGDGGPLQGVAQEWRGHWAQCWSPLGGSPTLQVRAGQEVALSAKHDDLSIQLALTPSSTLVTEVTPPPSSPGAPSSGGLPSVPGALAAGGEGDCGAPSHLSLPPMGAWLPPSAMQQLNGLQGSRWAFYEASLHSVMLQTLKALNAARAKHEGQGSCQAAAALEVVCLGSQISPDQLMPPLLAAACAHDICGSLSAGGQAVECKITALADHGAARKWLAAAGEKLEEWALGASRQQSHVTLHVLPEGSFMKRARHHLRLADQSQDVCTEQQQEQGTVLVLADPSYHQGKGAVPCTHLLQFWSDLDVVRRSEALKGRKVVSLPARAVLRAVAVSLPHLARTRLSLYQVEGCDLSAANAVLGGDGLLELSLGVPWQCGGEYTELSSRSNLLTLDLSSAPFTGAQSGSVELQVPPDAASQLHAVVVWVDYELQDAGQQQGAAEGGTGMGPQPSAAATAVEGGAGCSNVVDNGPCSIAYSATQTVLLLPQQQQQQQQQACLYGVKVSACLEEDGMKLSADLV